MEIAALTQRIEQALPGAEVYIRDLTGEGNHFEAFVISDSFAGQSLLKKQRLVMDPLSDLLTGPIHALTIKTFTKQEWEQSQG